MILDRADPALVAVTPCRYGRMMYLTNDRYIGSALARYGEYSESEVAMWRALLEPTSIVADIGANLGAHTVALATLVPQGLVIAFEPLRYLYHLMAGNVALNGLTNVLTYHACAGAAPGHLLVPALDLTHVGPDANYGGMHMQGHTTGNPVPVLRLDDVCPRIDFIKADVEGMERHVLEGAQRLLRECHPILYLENNPGPAQRDLIDYVHSLGYDCWWHLAPHYNPDNYHHAPAESEEITRVASYNMICLPQGDGNVALMGCDPIARVTG